MRTAINHTNGFILTHTASFVPFGKKYIQIRSFISSQVTLKHFFLQTNPYLYLHLCNLYNYTKKCVSNEMQGMLSTAGSNLCQSSNITIPHIPASSSSGFELACSSLQPSPLLSYDS